MVFYGYVGGRFRPYRWTRSTGERVLLRPGMTFRLTAADVVAQCAWICPGPLGTQWSTGWPGSLTMDVVLGEANGVPLACPDLFNSYCYTEEDGPTTWYVHEESGMSTKTCDSPTASTTGYHAGVQLSSNGSITAFLQVGSVGGDMYGLARKDIARKRLRCAELADGTYANELDSLNCDPFINGTLTIALLPC